MREALCRQFLVDIFQKVIDEAMPLGLKDVKLTGGEPLMHPRFGELLEIIRQNNLGLTIETNGLLCTPEIAAEIARFPRRFVSVSIDGSDKETHEWMRGVPGSFEKAKHAISNLVQEGVRPQIITTLIRRNAGQIEEIVRMAENLGASSVKFNVVMPAGRGEKLSETDETLSIGDLIRTRRICREDFASEDQVKGLFGYSLRISFSKRHSLRKRMF